MTDIAVAAVAGRFQPFHWGHFEYLVEAAKLGDRLVVGVTNPTPDAVRESSADTQRSTGSANPFSFEQRRSMITRTFRDYCPTIPVSVVQCDLRSPALLRSSLGDCDVVGVTVYDAWGEEKLQLFRDAGYRVEVLWRREDKLVTGSQVRDRLEHGQPWRHLVPHGTAEVIEAQSRR